MAKLQPCKNMDKIHQLLAKIMSGVEFLPDPIKDQQGRLYNKYVFAPKVVKKERNKANKKMASTAKTQSNGVFDVTKYGGKEDITEALNNAWKDACASTNPSKVLIPSGTYSLRQVTLAGPCKAAIELQVDGILKAPVDPNQFSGGNWVDFSHESALLMGRETLHGAKVLVAKIKIVKASQNIRFDFITNGLVRDITTRDSKNFHVNVLECKNLTFQHFTVTAPAESINTDGIHIGRSTGSTLSIQRLAQAMIVSPLAMAPKNYMSQEEIPNEKPVSSLQFANGVRIKSWPDLYGGAASNMHFEDIVMNNVQNPIALHQSKISDVSFKNIRGTSATPVAVKLACSSGIPCEKGAC
uniref:Pectate lyase superfamily protein domain-containing protein n=1 Tax=Salix viminalis TaxID=40686 RepID=A0A6N2MHS7_SALVM